MRFPPWLRLEDREIQKKEDNILYITWDKIKQTLAIPIPINGRGLYKFPDFSE